MAAPARRVAVMTAIIIPLWPAKRSAMLYDFPRDRIVRFVAPAAVLTEEDRLLRLSKLIAEALDKAPPRKKLRRSRLKDGAADPPR